MSVNWLHQLTHAHSYILLYSLSQFITIIILVHINAHSLAYLILESAHVVFQFPVLRSSSVSKGIEKSMLELTTVRMDTKQIRFLNLLVFLLLLIISRRVRVENDGVGVERW